MRVPRSLLQTCSAFRWFVRRMHLHGLQVTTVVIVTKQKCFCLEPRHIAYSTSQNSKFTSFIWTQQYRNLDSRSHDIKQKSWLNFCCRAMQHHPAMSCPSKHMQECIPRRWVPCFYRFLHDLWLNLLRSNLNRRQFIKSSKPRLQSPITPSSDKRQIKSQRPKSDKLKKK